MNRIVKFIGRMDASAWRALIITGLLLTSVVLMLVVGKMFLFDGEGDGLMAQLQTYLHEHRTAPYMFLVVAVLYCVLAFLGAPQFGLIGMTVLAFGSVLGFFYAWGATLVSASVAFWIGRGFGMSLVQRYGGDSILRLSRFMGRNVFIASAIVRNVPTAPAIVVNMAFGASDARFSGFLAGTGLGIIPKTLMIALFGQAVAQSLTGNPLFAAVSVVAMALLWIPLMLFARSNLAEKRGFTPEENAESETEKPQ
ncbi:VTT domain-containing protein [Ponticaulis sp.]|uniref:TVP38/TMEM64 family protein n=1 Tax=Ponticaulis sp. TaxID=2020902 RepID=UPI0025D03F12|nr:VTT domain-containing protein [Ponticaulis sp.]